MATNVNGILYLLSAACEQQWQNVLELCVQHDEITLLHT